MNHKDANALAEWISNNTKGFARCDGEKIYLEGTIDAFELLGYAQSLLTPKDIEAVYAENEDKYVARTRWVDQYGDLGIYVPGEGFQEFKRKL